MAKQEEAHVCGTERQWEANEGKEDAQEKHSHSLPPHSGATKITGHISHRRALNTAGAFYGVTVMATWDRSETDLYDALRRKRKKIYRHLITDDRDISIFKERYIGIHCIYYFPV